MRLQIFLLYLATWSLIAVTPGPAVMCAMAQASRYGFRSSFAGITGIQFGNLLFFMWIALGLAALLEAATSAFTVLRMVGAAYLFYLGYATWRDKRAFALDTTPQHATVGSLISKALLLNILNPKLTLFFLAFLPQFITHDGPTPLLQLLTLSGVFMAMTFGIFVLYGLLAHAFRQAVIESPRVQSWLRRSFAAAFAGLAIDLALSDR